MTPIHHTSGSGALSAGNLRGQRPEREREIRSCTRRTVVLLVLHQEGFKVSSISGRARPSPTPDPLAAPNFRLPRPQTGQPQTWLLRFSSTCHTTTLHTSDTTSHIKLQARWQDQRQHVVCCAVPLSGRTPYRQHPFQAVPLSGNTPFRPSPLKRLASLDTFHRRRFRACRRRPQRRDAASRSVLGGRVGCLVSPGDEKERDLNEGADQLNGGSD